MKLVILLPLLLMLSFGIGWTGEKEELQWKARALVAEANLLQTRLGDAQRVIQDFIKELDSKGYMATQDGTVVEKPKPPEPKQSPAPPPPQSKK